MTGFALGISLVLLAIAAALRSGGASLVRTPRADALHDGADGDARAGRVAELLDDRARLQPAMGMVHSGLLIAAAVPAVWALTVMTSGIPTLFALVLLGVVLAVVGDVLPRMWGRAMPRRLAYRFSILLEWAVKLGGRAADLIHEEEEEPGLHENSDQDTEEIALISSVLEFTDAVVREVMVPRPDMVVIGAEAPAEQALDLVVAEGRSRIPVTGESIDDIVGILYAKDLLGPTRSTDAVLRVREVMRDAYFIPESKRVSELLREMQGRRAHMAVVIDEFGGTAGLVTIEDLLEELVGEIVDEHDVEEPMVTPLEGGEYLIDARLHIDDLGELVGQEFPDDEWDTVGGLVLGLAGRVPREGESFEYDGLVLVAERVQGRRVAQVRIRHR